MPTGTGYNTLEGNEPLSQSVLDQQEKMRRSMQKAASSVKKQPAMTSIGAMAKENHQRAKETSRISTSSGSSDAVQPAFDTSTGAAQSAEEPVGGKKSGLVDAMKADGAMTKEYLKDMGGILSGEKEAAEITPTGKTKFESMKTRSGQYLEDMGGGSKALGGAKIAGYMVGASMLADMLNPFDND
jgi:hypothetical protein